jgi:hypothetical protein
MATNKGDQPRKKGSMPDGVRGPGGPPSASSGSSGSTRGPGSTRLPMGAAGASPRRQALERASYPVLARLHAMPRWIIVIAPAVLLFLGLILSGPWAWLGGIALLLVWVFVAWLTALSWPALTPGSRLFRLLVVLALAGVVVLKFMGRF